MSGAEGSAALRKLAEESLAGISVYGRMLTAAPDEWAPYDAKTIASEFMLPRWKALAEAVLRTNRSEPSGGTSPSDFQRGESTGAD